VGLAAEPKGKPELAPGTGPSGLAFNLAHPSRSAQEGMGSPRHEEGSRLCRRHGKALIVPLSPKANGVLKLLQPFSAHSDYVFPGERPRRATATRSTTSSRRSGRRWTAGAATSRPCSTRASRRRSAE